MRRAGPAAPRWHLLQCGLLHEAGRRIFDCCSVLLQARRLKQQHGGMWMLRGLGPTLGRGFVINAVNFTVFEWVVDAADAL